MELFHKMISGSLGIPERQIASTLHLLGEGATIPFISRYRKEATGGLDEVQIEQIKEQHDKLCDIAKRKETILGTGRCLSPLQTQTENPCGSRSPKRTRTACHNPLATTGE